MSDSNTTNNRAVWFDIPVVDLARANAFYAGVLACGVEPAVVGEVNFSVLEHAGGNGGCLVPGADEVTATKGILVYFNVDGRIREAVRMTQELGGKLIDDVTSLGPHGFRAVVIDSEGNRIALHAESDS